MVQVLDPPANRLHRATGLSQTPPFDLATHVEALITIQERAHAAWDAARHAIGVARELRSAYSWNVADHLIGVAQRAQAEADLRLGTLLLELDAAGGPDGA